MTCTVRRSWTLCPELILREACLDVNSRQWRIVRRFVFNMNSVSSYTMFIVVSARVSVDTDDSGHTWAPTKDGAPARATAVAWLVKSV